MEQEKRAMRKAAMEAKRKRLAELRRSREERSGDPGAGHSPVGEVQSEASATLESEGAEPDSTWAGAGAGDAGEMDEFVDELLASPNAIDAVPMEVQTRIAQEAIRTRRETLLRRCTWDGGKYRSVALVPRQSDKYSKGCQTQPVDATASLVAGEREVGKVLYSDDASEPDLHPEATMPGGMPESTPNDISGDALASLTSTDEYRGFVARAGRAIFRELRWGSGSESFAGDAPNGGGGPGASFSSQLGARADFVVEELSSGSGSRGAATSTKSSSLGRTAVSISSSSSSSAGSGGGGDGAAPGAGVASAPAVLQRVSLTLVDALAAGSNALGDGHTRAYPAGGGVFDSEPEGDRLGVSDSTGGDIGGEGEGERNRQHRSALSLAHASVGDRAVTDVAWCPQYPYLLLAAYAPAVGSIGGSRAPGPGGGLAAGATGYLRGDGAFVVDGVQVAGGRSRRRRRWDPSAGNNGTFGSSQRGDVALSSPGPPPSSSLGALRSVTAASGLVLAWDVTRGDGRSGPEMVFSAEEAVVRAQWHPQEARVAVGGCASGRLCVWDGRASCHPVLQSPPGNKSLSSAVVGLSVSGRGAGCTVHAASVDGQLASWDLAAGLQAVVGQGPGGGTPTDWHSFATKAVKYKPSEGPRRGLGLCSMAVSPDDPDAAVLGGADGGLFSARFGARGASVLQRLPAHAAAVADVRAHPDSARFEGVFATAGLDWAVRIWAPRATARPLVSVLGLGDAASAVDMHPAHAGVVATATAGGEVCLWSLVGHDGEARRMVTAPEVRVRLAASGQQVLRTGESEAEGACSAATAARWSQSGAALAVGDAAGRLHVLGVDAQVVSGCGAGRARGAMQRRLREVAGERGGALDGREGELDEVGGPGVGSGAAESKLAESDAAADSSHWLQPDYADMPEVDPATGLADGRLWFEPSGASVSAVHTGRSKTAVGADDAWGRELREATLMAGLVGLEDRN